jgi:hypothetical protein
MKYQARSQTAGQVRSPSTPLFPFWSYVSWFAEYFYKAEEAVNNCGESRMKNLDCCVTCDKKVWLNLLSEQDWQFVVSKRYLQCDNSDS